MTPLPAFPAMIPILKLIVDISPFLLIVYVFLSPAQMFSGVNWGSFRKQNPTPTGYLHNPIHPLSDCFLGVIRCIKIGCHFPQSVPNMDVWGSFA